MDPAAFLALLTGTAEDVIPYIGGGVAAGLVVFVVGFGIRKGIHAFQTMQFDRFDRDFDAVADEKEWWDSLSDDERDSYDPERNTDEKNRNDTAGSQADGW